MITKFYKFIILVFFSIFFISCSTTGDLVPGSKQLQINNIYVEYLNIGDIYFSLEKYDKAVTYYNYALGYKDIYWEVYYKLAKTYGIQKNWSKALEYYTTLLERDSENTSLQSSVAYLYSMNGDTKKAKQIYKDLLEKQDFNQEFYENYLSLLIMEGDIDNSQLAYDELAEKFPDNKNLEKFKKAIDKLIKDSSSESRKPSGTQDGKVESDSVEKK